MSYIKALAKGMKAHPVGTAVGVGFTTLDAGMTVKEQIDKGHSAPVAVAKGGARWAAMEMIPGLGFGVFAGSMIELGYTGVKAMSDHNARVMSPLYNKNFGGNFIDTKAAYTMRQRGLNAIKNSGIDTQNVLGNEARMYSSRSRRYE